MPSSESAPPTPEILFERPLVPDPALGPYRGRDYELLPDQPRTELIRGRLYAYPSLTIYLDRRLPDAAAARRPPLPGAPRPKAGRVASEGEVPPLRWGSLPVAHQLAVASLRKHFEPLEAAGGLAFRIPLDVHLADHSVVQPDVIAISAARREIVRDWIRGVPDLLVEVLSPESGRTDRLEKLMLYAECGVPEYWIVDLDLQVIDCLVNEGGRYVLSPPTDGRYRSLRLPEIQIDVLEFWRDLEREMQGIVRPRAAAGA